MYPSHKNFFPSPYHHHHHQVFNQLPALKPWGMAEFSLRLTAEVVMRSSHFSDLKIPLWKTWGRECLWNQWNVVQSWHRPEPLLKKQHKKNNQQPWNSWLWSRMADLIPRQHQLFWVFTLSSLSWVFVLCNLLFHFCVIFSLTKREQPLPRTHSVHMASIAKPTRQGASNLLH